MMMEWETTWKSRWRAVYFEMKLRRSTIRVQYVTNATAQNVADLSCFRCSADPVGRTNV
jgi:hypothetical protein